MENKSLNTIEKSNSDLYKSQLKNYKRAFNKIFSTCLKEIPRETIIELLKKKKIIKYELNLETNKFVLVEKIDTQQIKKIEESPNPLLDTRSKAEEDNTDVKTADVDNQSAGTTNINNTHREASDEKVHESTILLDESPHGAENVHNAKCKFSINRKCTGNWSPLRCDGLDVPDECKEMLSSSNHSKEKSQ